MNVMLRRLFTVEHFFKYIVSRTTYTVQYEMHEIGNDLTLNPPTETAVHDTVHWQFAREHSRSIALARRNCSQPQ